MKSAEGTGQTGLRGWLGVAVRLLVTLFFLVSILMLSRCGPTTQPAITTPTPIAATSQLRIEVGPPGAAVFVDGFRSGSTPVSIMLPPGQHTVRIEQEGYEPLVEMVNLAADGHATISGDLIPTLAGNAPTVTLVPTDMPESMQPLPDLLITRSLIELESGGSCDYASTRLGIRVWIENAGGSDAGPFVVETNGVPQTVAGGLAAGQTTSLWFSGYAFGGENVIIVDATAQVQETNEGNNRFAARLPVPTLPPTCTPPPEAPPVGTPTTPQPTVAPAQPTSTPAPTAAPAVTMREGKITIPTYPYAQYLTQDQNPTFNMSYTILDRTAYEAASPTPSNVTYQTFVVENQYLRLTFLPEVGGRLYEIVYKPTGNRVTYRNPVLKPSPWGPPEQGWWLAAGGFEWCLPVEEHGYEWGVPWKLSASNDGQSVTVTLRDSDADDRVRAEISVRLAAGAGYFTIRPRLENPTSSPQNVKYWTNAMLAPGGQNSPSADLRFVLPDAVRSVTVHSRGDDFLPGYNEQMPWPVFNGTDFSRLGNWNRWLGFFEDPAAGEFIAVYDYGFDEGVVRVFPTDATPGAKAFAFGWKDPIPPRNWTDDGSSYIEIHGGPAPTFDDSVTIPAGGHLQWTETWYPVAGLGGLRYANAIAALNLTTAGGEVQVGVIATRPWSGDLVLLVNGQERWRQGAALLPGQPLRKAVALGSDAPQTGRLTLRLEAPDGAVAAEYTAESKLK